MESGLQLIAILEKDTNADAIVSWSYPFLEEGLDKVLIAKSRLQEENVVTESYFSKFKENWVYVHTFNGTSLSLPRVVAFSIVILSKAFNPERFMRLCEMIGRRYSETGQPTRVLEAYLSAYTKDQFTFSQDSKYDAADFDDRKALFKGSLKALFSTFGMESAVIFLAMILKKRIAVFSSQLSPLLETIRTFPLLVWHRKNWALLRPFVTLSQLEIEELNAASIYVAGFTDKSVESREELYDLFVDVENRSVSVASHARNDFMLGKPLKELGITMTKFVEDEGVTEQQIIKEIAIKTKGFLDQLESVIPEGESQVSAEVLQNAELPAPVARFLWNLAIAEGKAQM